MKLLTSILLAAAALTATAQERTIKRLPEIGKAVEDIEYASNLSGFWFAAEISGSYSVLFNKDNNCPFAEFDVIAGYRFNDYLRVGAGFGGRYEFDDNLRYDDIPWGFPIYLDVRGNFIPQTYRNVVPYWSMDIGGTIRDGFMLRPSIGIRVGRQRSAFLLALGYTGQYMKIQKMIHTPLRSENIGANRFVSLLSLRIGYEF